MRITIKLSAEKKVIARFFIFVYILCDESERSRTDSERVLWSTRIFNFHRLLLPERGWRCGQRKRHSNLRSQRSFSHRCFVLLVKSPCTFPREAPTSKAVDSTYLE